MDDEIDLHQFNVDEANISPIAFDSPPAISPEPTGSNGLTASSDNNIDMDQPPSAIPQLLPSNFVTPPLHKTGGPMMVKSEDQQPMSSCKSNAKKPPPVELPSNTRLGITIHEWDMAAVWKWDVDGEDTCGICQYQFDGTCSECKLPGDDCPLVWGECKHVFHMHCIVKWTEAQNTPNALCPMCRRPWSY